MKIVFSLSVLLSKLWDNPHTYAADEVNILLMMTAKPVMFGLSVQGA